jgi:four helix bundle protein
MELTVAIYKPTRGFHREEQYGLTAQIRRAAVSIPSNIAEGQGRATAGEFRQFLGIARGSMCELQTQLEIARALSFGNTKLTNDAEALSNQVSKMLFGLIDSLRPKDDRELRTTNCEL